MNKQDSAKIVEKIHLIIDAVGKTEPTTDAMKIARGKNELGNFVDILDRIGFWVVIGIGLIFWSWVICNL